MCGFAGIYDLSGDRTVCASALKRMADAIAHRGPDGEGFMIEPGIGLAHRRLAVIDLNTGDQPMTDFDRRTSTVFNGEIYNYKELRNRLTGSGFRFCTQSDTEAIAAAWRHWGMSAADKLTGMFAIALWDRKENTLWLGRDPIGEKPLYYTVTPDKWLVFASELSAIVAYLGRTPSLDMEAVADYFAYGYVPDPKSIYRAIYKLAPGHQMRIRRGEGAIVEPTPYWRLCFEEGCETDLLASAEKLRAKLSNSVSARLAADVPLGAFLSGGVDSSGVVAMMADRAQASVKTCAIGFPDPRADERRYARQVAALYATDHREDVVEAGNIDLLGRMAASFGEPFADSSALPTFKVCEATRRHVTVALSGDGGDEVFAGYRRYPFFLREEKARRMMPKELRQTMFGSLAKLYPKADWAPRVLRAKATFEALSNDTVGGYFRSIALVPDGLRQKLFSRDFLLELNGYDPVEVLRGHAGRADTDDPLRLAQYLDIHTWLPGRMLVKVDRMAMANALEVRAPLLDPELVQWGFSLPAELKINGFDGKRVLKKALEPLLPSELLYRKKQGFSMPLSAWMRDGFGECLSELTRPGGRLSQSGIVNRRAVQTLVTEHQQGRRDHATVLWALMMFDAFLANASSAPHNAEAMPSLAA